MNTPVYKLSDGNIITFEREGADVFGVFRNINGGVEDKIRLPPGSNEYESAANSLIDSIYDTTTRGIPTDSNGNPITYIVEGFQDQSSSSTGGNNVVYELPRVTLSKVPDETSLNIAKVNKEILIQDNKDLNQALESELPPEVRFTNFVNSQKSTIKKRLIPFVIGLITPMAPQIVPIVVSQLGISGDSSVDSIKANAQAKKDEAQAKIDSAKDTATSAKETAKDKEKLKSLAIGAAPSLLALIPVEQLVNLINCPSQAKIQSILRQRNQLVNQINGIYKTTLTLTAFLGFTDIVISTIQTAIQLAKANPYPATGIPPTFPPLTSGVQTTIASFVAELENQIKVTNKTLSTVTITIGSFATFLGVILKFLSILDIILQFCAEDQNMDLEQINNEINALANPTIAATQSENNTYKGFTLGVKIDEKNESKYIRRYAVAQNKQGVDVLRTESSFASDPAVLISQLKFIIDSNPSITAE
jgi:hypothetical protein